MAKLEVGRFYKEIGLDGSTLIHHVTKQEGGKFYGVYYDLSEEFLDDREAPFRNAFINSLSLIETLTPREALILLANGFVLFKTMQGVRLTVEIVDGEKIIRHIDGSEIDYDSLGTLDLCDYNGFKIHALPELEAGE